MQFYACMQIIELVGNISDFERQNRFGRSEQLDKFCTSLVAKHMFFILASSEVKKNFK